MSKPTFVPDQENAQLQRDFDQHVLDLFTEQILQTSHSLGNLALVLLADAPIGVQRSFNRHNNTEVFIRHKQRRIAIRYTPLAMPPAPPTRLLWIDLVDETKHESKLVAPHGGEIQWHTTGPDLHGEGEPTTHITLRREIMGETRNDELKFIAASAAGQAALLWLLQA